MNLHSFVQFHDQQSCEMFIFVIIILKNEMHCKKLSTWQFYITLIFFLYHVLDEYILTPFKTNSSDINSYKIISIRVSASKIR